MRTAPAAVAALLPGLLAGCALIHPPAVIEKRFAAVVPADETAPLVQIAATSAPAEHGGSGVRLTELGDRAQAALIAATAGHPPAEIDAPNDGGGDPDVGIADTIERRIVVAVRPAEFLAPGDRVDAIRVRIEVAPAQQRDWRITGWSQASNGETTVDLGRLTDSTSSKLTASTGVALGPSLPGAAVGGELDRSATRETVINDATAFDAAVDASGNAWLDETAGWRVSLAHNLAISMTIAAPGSRLRPRKLVAATALMRDDPNAKGLSSPVPAAQVQLRETTVYAHLADDRPVCGHAELTYRVRHIVNARARSTFSESDDKIAFLKGTSEATFLLAPAPYKPPYALVTGSYRLAYAMAPAEPAGLLFASLEEATAFRNWYVRTLPAGGRLNNAAVGVAIPGHRVRPLTRAEAGTLVPTVADPGRLAAARAADLDICRSPGG